MGIICIIWVIFFIFRMIVDSFRRYSLMGLPMKKNLVSDVIAFRRDFGIGDFIISGL